MPARAYLSILIVFSLLIGPVNYWFLWRKRQQVLLVLTAPLISAVFIVLLAGYVVAGEGLGVQRPRRDVHDARSGQEAGRRRARSVSLYAAGMTPARRPALRRATSPCSRSAPTAPAAATRMTLDLTETQRFSAGVMQARSPTNFEEIGCRVLRASG